jgi:hypothetical protein
MRMPIKGSAAERNSHEQKIQVSLGGLGQACPKHAFAKALDNNIT